MMRSATVDRPRVIFHLARASAWKSAKKHARPYETPSFQEDGFIQACDDGLFLKQIAEKRHARHQQGGDFIVIEIDTDHPSFTNEVVYIPQIDTEFANGLHDDDYEHPRIFGTISPKVVISEQVISKPSVELNEGDGGNQVNPPPPTEPPPRQARFLCCLPGSASANTVTSILPSFITGIQPIPTLSAPSMTAKGDNWSGYDESIEVSTSFSSNDLTRTSSDASYKSAQAYL